MSAPGQDTNTSPNGSAAPTPPPPQIVSNYRRPDWEPPLFLANEIDGRRELIYAFLLAVGGPLIAIFAIYGIAVPFAGLLAACVALKRGHNLAVLAVVLNIAAIPAAIFVHFGLLFF